MEIFKKGSNYLRQNGLLQIFRVLFRLIRRYVYIVRIDPSSKIILQSTLDRLKVTASSEAVVEALGKKIGWEYTGKFLKYINEVEKFLTLQSNLPSQILVHASQLPPNARPSQRRNILFITAEFPSPHHGGGNRVLNFIKTLAPNNNIYLCTAYNPERHEQILPVLEPYCHKILKLPFNRFERKQSQIRKWLGKTQIDVVHYEWPRSLENYDPSFGKLQIFTFMEAVGLRLLMDMERLTPLTDIWLEKLEQLAYALYLEIVKASTVDVRIAVTTKDAEFFKELCPSQEYTVLNHGLVFEEFTLPDVPPETNTLTFVGNYLHYPNAEAIEFFFDKIWKNICNEIPDVRIYLVGTNPTKRMLQMADNKQVIVTGTVEDVRPYIQKAVICIAPLITGAGLRGKVIEYAALRRTFVATNIATTDLVFRDGVDYFCADIASEFSEKILVLLKNQKRTDQMSISAYEIAQQNYDTKRLTGFLLLLYEHCEKYLNEA